MKRIWVEFAFICILLSTVFGIAVYSHIGPIEDCPATLSTDEVENETELANETVIEFLDLPLHQQQEFEQALEEGYTEIESQSDWEYDWVIHYQETHYSISIGIC